MEKEVAHVLILFQIEYLYITAAAYGLGKGVCLTDREAKLRPFGFFGLGASDLSPDRSGVNGATRFTFALGAGAKYNVSNHLGFRGQIKWSPTYLTTTDGGYWCDPFWGGCWVVGNNHYLHEFDFTGGITLRF